MTPKNILTNRNFCPMPWTGLMYNVDGQIKNCIRSAGPIGNLKKNSIQEILHGPVNLETQQRMLANQPAQDCHTCYDVEGDKTGFDIISDRIFYIRELKHVPLDTYQHNQHELHAIDVRWTNLCNFSCVYCGPEFSSRWAEEFGKTITKPDRVEFENFKRYIFDRAATLKHVYLAGGEPLLMKENIELLDLLQKVNPGVNLRINTNLSKTNTQVFDRICEFKNVHWTVSVETIADEFEYIRYGASWKDFLDNLMTIQKLNHKISFNMLWLLLNYRSVFTCVDYLNSLGFHNNSFIIGALLAPEYLNIRHLPDYMLQLIKQELQDRIDQGPGYLLEDSYRNLLRYITQPFKKDLSLAFTQIKKLDQRRGLDSSKIFTELYTFREGN